MLHTLYTTKKFLTISFLGCCLILGACQKELNTNPLDQFANEKFWNTENEVMLALAGLYRGNIQMNGQSEFSPTDWWSYHGLLYLEFATDNAYDRRGDNSVFNKLSDGTMTTSLSLIGDYWAISYKRIARVNFFLENIGKAPLSAELLARYTAEARFIRATQYFYLSQYWGDVPLVTGTLTLEEANNVKKATKQEIVDFTIAELRESADQLPRYASLSAAGKGRTSKQAALAFLGRLQLSEKSFGDAAKTYSEIIALNEHDIDPDYKGLFDGTNEASKEIIFATQYVVDLAGNGMLQHNYPASAGGWHLYCPLGSLVEAYDFKDGTKFDYDSPKYNPKNITAGRDPRLSYSILTNGDLFKNVAYVTHPDSVRAKDQLSTTKQATRTGYGLRKFNAEGFVGNLQNSGIDLPLIRYAEVLLSYLEAKIENGDPITQALLDQTINKVRGRVSVQMPAITITDANLLRPILRKERRLEMAFEGTRYWDLKRWDIAKDVLNADFYGAPYPGAKNIRVKPAGVKDKFARWYVTQKKYRASEDRNWPIPQSEMNINPNLK